MRVNPSLTHACFEWAGINERKNIFSSLVLSVCADLLLFVQASKTSAAAPIMKVLRIEFLNADSIEKKV